MMEWLTKNLLVKSTAPDWSQNILTKSNVSNIRPETLQQVKESMIKSYRSFFLNKVGN